MFPSFFKKNYSVDIFELGENLLMNECNMFTIVETMMKIKASLIVLIGEDHKMQMKIQETYLNLATLHVAHIHDHDCSVKKKDSEYKDFLQRDERLYFHNSLNSIIKKQIEAGIRKKFVITKKMDQEQGGIQERIDFTDTA